jgi:hypothetical protein
MDICIFLLITFNPFVMKITWLLPALLLCQCQSAKITQKEACPRYTVTLLEESKVALIDKDHPGSAGNQLGYEGGIVFMHNNEFQMFVTEQVKGLVRTLTGHWKSADGVNWTRVKTLQQSVDTQGDPRHAIWSPMPYYNENENRWNLFYVGYEQMDPWHGRVFRAYSSKPGRDGFDGPYIDVPGTVLSYTDANRDPWEGSMGTAAFYPYKVGNKWYAFYNSGDAKTRWDEGLATADSLEGKWTRDRTPLPTLSYSENPIVIRLKDGTYFCVFDHLANCLTKCHAIGYAYSLDGVHWVQDFLDIPMPLWATSVRTPQSLIPAGGDDYWVYFTAHTAKKFDSMGRIKVRINRH